MNEYRITKYDPALRVNGRYTVPDWTSIHDIGRAFHGSVLTAEAYRKTEDAYVQTCLDVLRRAGVDTLKVPGLEVYSQAAAPVKRLAGGDEIGGFIRQCLREQCWARLTGRRIFIHFGYDYYMYIGTRLPCADMAEIAGANGLFCEPFCSPYKKPGLRDLFFRAKGK